MATPRNTNFIIQAPKPIDSRMQVATFADLDAIPVKFNHMVTQVIDEDVSYKYYSATNTWVSQSLSVPTNQIAVGTSTGVKGFPDFTFDGSKILLGASAGIDRVEFYKGHLQVFGNGIIAVPAWQFSDSHAIQIASNRIVYHNKGSGLSTTLSFTAPTGSSKTITFKSESGEVALMSDLASKADLVGGLVPASQLPAFVDDVLEYADYATMVANGDGKAEQTGVIYITLDDNAQFRWSGKTHVPIGESLDASAVKVLYESNANTNAFTDALLTLLNNHSGVNTGDQDLSGFVSKSGTPVNNQLAIWTADGIIQGDNAVILDNDSGFRGLSLGTDNSIAGILNLYGHTNSFGNSALNLFTNNGITEATKWSILVHPTTGNLIVQASGGTGGGFVFDVNIATAIVRMPASTLALIEASDGKTIATKEYVESKVIPSLDRITSVTGAQNVDWTKTTKEFTLTGATTFSDINFPAHPETITIHMTGEFAFTPPAYWDIAGLADYDGTVWNVLALDYYNDGTDDIVRGTLSPIA